MQKKNIRIMLCMAFLQGLVFYSAVATLYRQRAGVGMLEMALIESLSLGLALLLEIPWGLAADRLGYRRTMIICSLLYASSKVIFWQAEGFGGFLAERVLLSVVCAGLSGVDESLLYLSYPEGSHQQRVFGLYGALGNAGVLAAALIFSIFMGENYRLAALCTAIAYALAAVLSFFLDEVKAPASQPRPALAPLREAFRSLRSVKGLLPLILSGACFGEALHYASTFLSQLQYQRAGLGSAAMGLCFTVTTALSLLGPLSAPVTNRLGQRRTGLALMLAGGALCFILAISPSAWVSLAALSGLEAAMALYFPLHAVMENARVASPDRATALSVNALLSSGVGMAANLLLGAGAERSLPLSLLFCGGACLSSALLFAKTGK